MIKKFILTIILLFVLNFDLSFAYKQDFFDKSRNRLIPVEIYDKSNSVIQKKIVIISHGYGIVKNTDYSFIANYLKEKDYFVVSIQHDMPGDKPLARTGNLFERRMPIWESGVKNISFIIYELKKLKPELNFDQLILIGHSNGGDISMKFAQENSAIVSKIISLDSLRFPYPKNIPILHFEAVDTKPDDGVISSDNVKSIKINDAKHIDFCDQGPQDIKEIVLKLVSKFLN